MENNKKSLQQNLTRLANAKSVDNNRKIDLQINKTTQKNSRRRGLAVTAKNSNDHFSQRSPRQQQQQGQHLVNSNRYAEKHASHSIDANGGEVGGDCAAGGCAHSNIGSLQHSTDDVQDSNGGNGNNSAYAGSTTNGSIGRNLAAHSSSDQFAASSRLGEGGKAVGKSARGSAASKKSTAFTPELNSVFSGRKKQNHNHLLNFHYASLDVFSDYHDYPQQRGGHNGHGNGANQKGIAGNAKKYHGYNKEMFLQANFQFVIRANAKPNFNESADTLVCWEAIEQINIHANEEPCCPICLYPPVAAKLTRCGHAYCWPCILHYLALSDKSWRKCPICYEAVHISDLKSTAIMQQQVKNGNDFITLQLMHRPKGSLYIEKYEGQLKSKEYFPYLYDEDEKQQKMFSKFLLAGRVDILNIIEREQKELTCCEDMDSPEYMFVQQALDLLNQRRDDLAVMEFEEEKKFKNKQEVKMEEMENILGAKQPESNVKYYYFYQSIDGQNIYLHPLNIKMLQACYDSLDKGPRTIEGRILQMDHYSMDENTRKKFTCLGHLPLTRQFAVVELDLKPPIITQAIMDMFYDDITYRKLERRRRQCEESKREKKINEFNDRQMGKLIATTRNLNLTSTNEFPTCGFDIPLGGGAEDATLATTPSPTHVHSTTYSAALTVGASATTGVNNTQLWPDLASTSSGVMNFSIATKGKPGWAAKASAISKAAVVPPTDFSSDGEKNSTTQHQNTLSDVLTQAMSQRQQKNSKKSEGHKKNKKTKKMQPLFTTGMNFNGN